MIPRFLRKHLETKFKEQFSGGGMEMEIHFTLPPGEAALTSPDSISWVVFNNPVSLFIGGIAAVLLELAEPSIRTGVWDHTTFRTDPLRRMRRTGLAAMITVYGARSVAEKMIAGVRRMHDRVHGETPDGLPYRANDPELLRWVHATAAFGFLEAYHHYVKPVSFENRDRFYAEGEPVARLYGAENAPHSEADLQALFAAMQPRLERSEIVFEFLDIMRRLPIFPRPLRFLNALFVRAAIEILPPAIRETLGLCHLSLPTAAKPVLRWLGGVAEQLHFSSSPAALARKRLDQSLD